ncbi:ABC transporter substrate-binding protein [Photobacterium sp. TLY01]|uniref:ABC transporter substrate-binding protein n=1 Tax=Photobacterium sp. TLY01 TaxID=2907534 RepID=UPI00351D2ADC
MKMTWIALGLAIAAAMPALASEAQTDTPPITEMSWQAIEEQARGQTVFLNAWGGSQPINSYLRWVAREVKSRYDITLNHVKVADIAETTQRLLAEKAAGKQTGGSVDMVWINGENFRTMKTNHLLDGPFVAQLPNWELVDKQLPVYEDFTESTEGLEAPWGVGQLVFIHDSQTLSNPPNSFAELLSLAVAFPGKVTYPQPPAFHGTSFLKAALIELTNAAPALYEPIDLTTEEKKFASITAPLWKYLDQLHAVAWQQGKRFPASSTEMMQLLDDRQLLVAITFNPNEAKAAIERGDLPESAKAFAFEQGALSNIHFLAIPWNASAKAGARVVINFLMSPEAQRRKANIQIWGDPAVLTPEAMGADETQGFELYRAIPEPHPSWQTALEAAWQQRYGH